jgi:hypothetical protein
METRLRVARYGYALVAWLFAFGILTQVFLIGLSLLGERPSWQSHIGLGHGLAIAPLLLIVFAYVGRLSRSIKLLTWLALVVYVLLADVVIFLRGSVPVVAALHPVLAVGLFGLVGFLAVQAWHLLREARATPLLATSSR